VRVGLSRVYRGRIGGKVRHVDKSGGAELGVAHETLGAWRVVKASGRSSAKTERFVAPREGMIAGVGSRCSKDASVCSSVWTTAAGTAP